jgi:hypothetical protein
MGLRMADMAFTVIKLKSVTLKKAKRHIVIKGTVKLLKFNQKKMDLTIFFRQKHNYITSHRHKTETECLTLFRWLHSKKPEDP